MARVIVPVSAGNLIRAMIRWCDRSTHSSTERHESWESRRALSIVTAWALSKDKFHGFADFDCSSNNPNHVEIDHRAHRATNSRLTRRSRCSRWFSQFTTGNMTTTAAACSTPGNCR